MKGKLFKLPVVSIVASVAGIAALIGSFSVLSHFPIFQPTPAPTPTPEALHVKAVSALGRIQPQGEVIQVAPPPSLGGAKIDKLLVEEGDWVQKGQVIALLDNYDLKQKAVELAEKEVKVGKANLAIVQAGAKEGEIKAQEAKIARLQEELAGVTARDRAKIARLEAQRQGEKETQTAAIARLQTELENGKREFQRYQQLGRDGAISDSTLDSRRLTWETAREKLQEGRANLDKTLTTLTEEIRETQAESQREIDSLQEQIRGARAELASIAEIRGVDLEKARTELERAIANLDHAREDWQLSQVRAPFRGQVLKIHSYPGEKADSEQGVVELGRTDRMAVIAEVYESDIAKVRRGQRAEIVSENASFPNKIYGSVTQVGLEIGKKDVLETDPAADVDVRVVEVKILLDPESSRLVAGLTNAKVIVEILL